MQFNSYTYILLFFPVTLVIYFLFNRIRKNAGKIILLLASLVFYSVGNLKYTIVLCVSIFINCLFHAAMKKGNRKKMILTAGIIVNLLILIYFKYLNFFIDTINVIFRSDIKFLEILLPLGISFYTFQQIIYLVNLYQNKVSDQSMLSYVLYILYFPKLLMGPLSDPEGLISQFDDPLKRKVNVENITKGIQIFTIGLFKKVILADTFVKAADLGFGNISAASTIDLLIVIMSYVLQLYFDFSGYSDMAIGSSKMLNIDLPMNFDSPYKVLCIRDFWKRWHITLTQYFTKYIYYPLGGSRKGEFRAALNTIAVFLVSGIWHGASWKFVVWGLIVALCNILDKALDKVRVKLPKFLQWCIAFLTIVVFCILFRADSISHWGEIFGHMFSGINLSISSELLQTFDLPESVYLMNVLHLTNLYRFRILWAAFFLVSSFCFCMIPANSSRRTYKTTVMSMVITTAAFTWCILALGTEPTFVYNNF